MKLHRRAFTRAPNNSATDRTPWDLRRQRFNIATPQYVYLNRLFGNDLETIKVGYGGLIGSGAGQCFAQYTPGSLALGWQQIQFTSIWGGS